MSMGDSDSSHGPSIGGHRRRVQSMHHVSSGMVHEQEGPGPDEAVTDMNDEDEADEEDQERESTLLVDTPVEEKGRRRVKRADIDAMETD